MKVPYLEDFGVVSGSHAVAGFVSLVYAMVVSRLLGVADYGFYQAIMAIYSTLVAFVGPLGLAVMHCVAVSAKASRPFVVGWFIRFALLVGSICAIGLACLAPWLSGILYGSISPIIWMALLVALTALLTVFYGAVQADNAFVLYGMSKIAESLIGLVFGSALVAIGAGAAGAVLGYVLGMAFILLFFFTRRGLYGFSKNTVDIWAERQVFAFVALAYGTIFFVSDFSAVLARSRLSAETSGLYGALHNSRHLVLPFCFALASPLYLRTVSLGGGHGAFLQVLALISILGGVFLGMGIFIPEVPFRVIYGTAFVRAAEYMALYGILLFLQMVCIATMFYQIARKWITLRHVLVPVIVIVFRMMLPGLTIQKLIVAQIMAWACFLLYSLLHLGLSKQVSVCGRPRGT
jgi:O-antigen/teichoic acid export membrane protein